VTRNGKIIVLTSRQFVTLCDMEEGNKCNPKCILIKLNSIMLNYTVDLLLIVKFLNDYYYGLKNYFHEEWNKLLPHKSHD
jgi:hypothetical protein